MGIPSKHISITLILSASALVAIIAVNMHLEIGMHDIIRDGSFLSDLGIILWSVSATVCFFTAVIIRDSQGKNIRYFLLYSALLSTYFLFDDFFEIHETVVLIYFGIDENKVFTLIAVAILVYLIAFKQILLQTNYLVLLMALLFLATSVLADVGLAAIEIIYIVLFLSFSIFFYLMFFNRSQLPKYLTTFLIAIGLSAAYIYLHLNFEYSEYILEDGAKWLGIASWCSYYLHTTYQFIIDTSANGKINHPTV